MYFLLVALFFLFSLLTGYAIMKTLWVFAILFGVLAASVLVILINRYRKRKKKKSDGNEGSSWLDCGTPIDCIECPSTGSSKRKGDCDCDDCGGVDCAPDCSP